MWECKCRVFVYSRRLRWRRRPRKLKNKSRCGPTATTNIYQQQRRRKKLTAAGGNSSGREAVGMEWLPMADWSIGLPLPRLVVAAQRGNKGGSVAGAGRRGGNVAMSYTASRMDYSIVSLTFRRHDRRAARCAIRGIDQREQATFARHRRRIGRRGQLVAR